MLVSNGENPWVEPSAIEVGGKYEGLGTGIGYGGFNSSICIWEGHWNNRAYFFSNKYV